MSRVRAYLPYVVVAAVAFLWLLESCETSRWREQAEAVGDTLRMQKAALEEAEQARADAEGELEQERERHTADVERTTRIVYREVDVQIEAGRDLRETFDRIGEQLPELAATAHEQLDRVEGSHARERHAWTEQAQAWAELSAQQDTVIERLREERDRWAERARLHAAEAAAWEREANPSIRDRLKREIPKVVVVATVSYLAGRGS